MCISVYECVCYMCMYVCLRYMSVLCDYVYICMNVVAGYNCVHEWYICVCMCVYYVYLWSVCIVCVSICVNVFHMLVCVCECNVRVRVQVSVLTQEDREWCQLALLLSLLVYC